jgi:transcriptional regulator with XRE-family HTH domain
MRETGAALKAAMAPMLERPGWSVARLSRETGIQRGTIYGWWRGDARPTRASMERVARALGVDVATLPLHESPESAHTISGDSLADAIRELTAELREARQERAAVTRRMDEVEAVLRTLVAPAMTGGAEPAPRPPTAGSGR